MSRFGVGFMLIAIIGCSVAINGRAGARTALETGYGERVSPDEAALESEMAALSVGILKRDSPGKSPMPRDAHAKHHGCARARFAVDKEVPLGFRAGVLSEPGKEYAGWIRFSNGSPKSQDDKDGDARGMALKLMGVEGEKLLAAERAAQTQDFLMISSDVFFIKDSKDYVEFFKLIVKGSNPAWFFFGRLPWRWTEFGVARRIAKQGKSVVNPLVSRYFSTTPYLLGDKSVIKFAVMPCAGSPDAKNDFAGSGDYLRLNMAKSLDVSHGGPACFRFMVQRRTQPATMSVEDSRLPWDQAASPFVPVATITIPVQEFSGEHQMRFCENLSFTPWHGLPAHRPLGNINRARKVVYEAISAVRHETNNEIRRETTVNDGP